jgi:hypothetical protein
VDGVILRGETGNPRCVTIRSAGTGSILICTDLSQPTRIEGLTLTLAPDVVDPTTKRGGGILVNGGSVTVSDCVFEGLTADYGGAVWCGGGATPLFMGCRFTDNHARATGSTLNVVDSSTPLFTTSQVEVSFADGINVVWGARASFVACTIVGTGASPNFTEWDAGGVSLQHCIVSEMGWWLNSPGALEATCSNFHPWVPPSPDGLIGTDGNISVDPLFCGAPNPISPYALAPDSPCLEGNDPGCGTMGAFQAGCSVSAAPEPIQVSRTALRGNYPNPFNPSTTILYSLDASRHVRITLYDIAGRLVRVLVDEVAPAGEREIAWDGRNAAGRPCSAGVYFIQMKTDTVRDTRRMSLIK